MMKLYVKFKKPDTLEEFLTLFFNYKNPYDKYLRGVATYFDKECLKLHCLSGKLRSFEDLFDLVNTYYDNVSIKTLLHTLLTLKLKRDNEDLFLHTGTCSGIKRIRMLYVPLGHVSFDGSNIKYDSKYSWKELFTMLDINSKEDMIKYKTKIHEKV